MRDSLGDRIKHNYENASRFILPKRMPIMLRVDGKAFHTYCSKLERPFDNAFMEAMDRCAMAICEEAQGAVLAYVQSDEINVLLHNYRRLDTAAWFDNNLQKIVSVSAGIASATMTHWSATIFGHMRPAVFDARAFVLPEAEVANAFLWRQQDASRNSITMMAQSMFSEKEILGRASAERQEMIFQKSGRNWNDLPTRLKRGRCLVRQSFTDSEGTARSRWVVDDEIPIFSQNRAYIEDLLAVEPEESSPEPRFGERKAL